MSSSAKCSSYEIACVNGRTVFNATDIRELCNEIRKFGIENERLKRGEFTEEEYATFCENLSFEKRLRLFNKNNQYACPEGMQFVAVKIPEGWELDCREMRLPLRGEYVADQKINQAVLIESDGCIIPRVVIKKKFQWPEWLTADYITQNQSGTWTFWKCKNRPTVDGNKWFRPNIGVSDFIIFSEDNLQMLKLELPYFANWQDSLMENPNRGNPK